jgi:hypothetical protein
VFDKSETLVIQIGRPGTYNEKIILRCHGGGYNIWFARDEFHVYKN